MFELSLMFIFPTVYGQISGWKLSETGYLTPLKLINLDYIMCELSVMFIFPIDKFYSYEQNIWPIRLETVRNRVSESSETLKP